MVMYFNWKMWEIVQFVANTWTKRQWLLSIISASHQKTHIVTRRCNLIQRYFISTGEYLLRCKSDFLCTDKSDFLSWQIWFASSQMFDLFQETWPTWKYSAMANLTRSIATKTSPKNWNFVKNQLDQLDLACCNGEISKMWLFIIDWKSLETMMKAKQWIDRHPIGPTNLRSAVKIFVVELREGLVSKV